MLAALAALLTAAPANAARRHQLGYHAAYAKLVRWERSQGARPVVLAFARLSSRAVRFRVDEWGIHRGDNLVYRCAVTIRWRPGWLRVRYRLLKGWIV